MINHHHLGAALFSETTISETVFGDRINQDTAETSYAPHFPGAFPISRQFFGQFFRVSLPNINPGKLHVLYLPEFVEGSIYRKHQEPLLYGG